MKLKKSLSMNLENKRILMLYLLLLFVLNICVNSFMQIKLLYLDDLSTWNEFSQMTSLQMIFNTAANKFRPVYYFILKLCYKLFLPRVYLFGIFTLMFNFFIIALLFYVIFKITNKPLVAFLGSTIYTVSRFAYYNISQVHGIMEQMALGLAILVLFLLWLYIEKSNKNYFYMACIFLFIIPFVHERYIALYPLFVLAVILGTKSDKFDKLKCFILSAVTFVVPFYIRILFLKDRAFDGTGGTNMKETFNFKDFFRHFKSGLLYLFGINDGPAYLNGIEQSNVLPWVKSLNIVFVVIVSIVAGLYIFFLVKNKDKKDKMKKQLKLMALLVSFIFLTLICACATIRLEMRWIYTPYVGFIILLSNMIAFIHTHVNLSIKKYFCIVVSFSMLCVIIPAELYFRNNYKNIYYWSTYQIYNSVFDQTVARYRDELWTKKLVMVSKDAVVFGENGTDLQTSLKMIAPDKTVNLEMYNDVKNIPANYYSDDSKIILTIDSYNQKVVNLKDII